MNNMIRCPSCAASLNVLPNAPSMYCSCCGSLIQLGSAFSNVSETNMQQLRERSQMAYNLASMIEAVKEPMLNIENQRQRLEYLKNECRDARLRYENFLANPAEMPEMSREVQENALRGRIQFLGNQVVEARQKYFEYENTLARYPHLNIPSQYQNAEALNYILNLFYSQQAFCLMEAFGKYDDYLKQIRSVSAQPSEQFSQEQNGQPDYVRSDIASHQDADIRDAYNVYERFENHCDNDGFREMIPEPDNGSDRQSRFLRKASRKLAKNSENKEKSRFVGRLGRRITDQAAERVGESLKERTAHAAQDVVVNQAKEMAKRAAADKAKKMAKQAAQDVVAKQAKEMAKRAAADKAKKMAKQAAAQQADKMARQVISQQSSQIARNAGKKIGKAAAKGAWKGLKNML